jgi:crotonobetainyl-CoA:carnitine CoA-transferase CaiB-like acyl-CoA transferase
LSLPDLKADPAYATNNQRVVLRPQLLAALRARLAMRTAGELAELMERAGLPFAPIRKPEDLYDDPHLRATGGLADVRLPDGDKAGLTVKTTLLPITLGGERLGVRLDPPRIGEHTRALLSSLGLAGDDIDRLYRQRAVA